MSGLLLALVIAGLGSLAVWGTVVSERDRTDREAHRRLMAELRRHR